jgi:sodium-dependent dicarboxylate transporter 2/3/5
MSNTATATMLVPVAAQLDPASPALPILIALGASFGMPFAISTPPNAMVVGAGLRGRELLVPGLTVMIGGSVLLALTGPAVLRWFGIG